MPKSSHKTKKLSAAQAMVEFALALPVLLLVIYGLIETGRLLFIYASVVTAARQAARYGSATGLDSSNQRYYQNCDGIRAAARAVQFIQRFSSIDISFDNPGPPVWGPVSCPMSDVGHPVNGDRIRVTVRAVYNPIVPLVPIRPFTISSTSTRTLLVGAFIALDNPSQGFHGSGTQGFVLTKWASTDYYYHVGDVITYHYTIQNTGTTPIDGPFKIMDNKINGGAPFGCTGAPNPLPGPSAVITCPDQVYTITAQDITSPEVTNHARAINADGSVASNEAVYTVSFVPQPHITLQKSGQLQGSSVDVGKIVRYTFTITNDGNMPLQSPYGINDSLIARNNLSCPGDPATLDVGGIVTCTGDYSLTKADINGSFITNTASATAMNGTNVVTSDPVTARTPVPLLLLNSITTNLPANTPYTALGQSITFKYSYTNRGTKDLTGLTVHSASFGSINCPDIPAGGTKECDYVHAITQDDLDAGAIAESANMTGSQTKPSETWTSNTATLLVQGSQTGAVTISITPDVATPPNGTSFAAGTNITFKFTFQNSGNISLKGPFTITTDNTTMGTFTCSAAEPLKVGASATCTDIAILLTDADIAAGRLVINATGTAYPYLGTSSVAPDTKTAIVVTYTLPRLALVKTPNKPSFTAAGDTISYSYGLQNTGGVQDLTITAPFALQDDKFPGTPINCPTGTIAVGATLDCGSLIYTATDADVANLTITNTLTYVSGSAVGVSPPNTPATLASTSITRNVPLLSCSPTTLRSSTIADGSNQTWLIWNKTGTDLHITGGWMRWDNPVVLTQVYLGTTLVDVKGASILLLPSSGWPVLSYIPGTAFDSTDATPMVLKFSGTASGIKVYLTFQETFDGLTCTLSSP